MLGFMSEVVQEYWSVKGRPPTEGELAERLEISVAKAQELAHLGDAVLSLDAMSEGERSSMLDFIPDRDAAPVDQRVMDRERSERVAEALRRLSEREGNVIRHRFGFKSGRTRSLRKVSARLGLSQEGVRRIEQRALTKLRRPHVRRMISGLV